MAINGYSVGVTQPVTASEFHVPQTTGLTSGGGKKSSGGQVSSQTKYDPVETCSGRQLLTGPRVPNRRWRNT